MMLCAALSLSVFAVALNGRFEFYLKNLFILNMCAAAVCRPFVAFYRRMVSFIWPEQKADLVQYVPSPSQLELHADTGDTGQYDDEDNTYFRCTRELDFHKLMLSDFPRTDAYRQSILLSRDKLKDKAVIDVGCGCGILSIFACQAGARHVLAIEASECIWYASRVVAENNYEDVVMLVKARIEDAKPPKEKFDVLISEWMGACLLNEWMLPSVIHARDRFLKKGGLMFPGKITMYIAMVQETQYLKNREDFWEHEAKEQYKVNMACLASEECTAVIGKKITHTVFPDEIVSAPRKLFTVDLHTIKLEDSDRFIGDFCLVSVDSCEVYGFCLWFKTFFPADVDLDTSPFHDKTHWSQNVLYVNPFSVDHGKGVVGYVTFTRNPKHKRNLAISLRFKKAGEDKMQTVEFS